MTTQLFAAAFAAAGLVAAQQNPPSSAPAPDRAQVVLTGCLEHGDEIKVPGTADTTLETISFVLTQAVAATSSASAANTVVGTSGTTPQRYRLDASVEKLGTHVGQKVQVTGTLADKPTEPAGAGSKANLPRVVVDSVKVIDATCPK